MSLHTTRGSVIGLFEQSIILPSSPVIETYTDTTFTFLTTFDLKFYLSFSLVFFTISFVSCNFVILFIRTLQIRFTSLHRIMYISSKALHTYIHVVEKHLHTNKHTTHIHLFSNIHIFYADIHKSRYIELKGTQRQLYTTTYVGSDTYLNTQI